MFGIITILGVFIIMNKRSLPSQTKRCFVIVCTVGTSKTLVPGMYRYTKHKLKPDLRRESNAAFCQDSCPAAQTTAACTWARGGACCHGGAGVAVSLAVPERCRMASHTDAITEIGCFGRQQQQNRVSQSCPIYGAVLACTASRRTRESTRIVCSAHAHAFVCSLLL